MLLQLCQKQDYLAKLRSEKTELLTFSFNMTVSRNLVLALQRGKKLLRLPAFPGASPEQSWYRRPGWPLHIMYIVCRQSLALLDPPSAHKPSFGNPGFEPPTGHFLKADA